MTLPIERRRFLAGAAAAGTATAVGAAALAAKASADDETSEPTAARPNIVLVLADDLGYSDLGCFGSEIATPHLNGLASSGRLFTQFYNNARCCPSRASLLTGLYPTQTGVGNLTEDEGSPGYQGYLNRSCVTFAEALGLAGYRSSISGKWHVAPLDNNDAWPHTRGFDRSFCQLGGDGGYFDPSLYLDGEPIGRPDDPNFYLTDAVTNHAIESIRAFAAENAPFVSYVSYPAPHWPLHAWPEDIAQYRGTYGAGWEQLRQERFERQRQLGIVGTDTELPMGDGEVPDWESAGFHDWQDARMAVYAAQVTAMDRGIGRIVATLHEQGIAEQTVVLFLSDNGGSAEKLPDNDPNVEPGPEGTRMSYGPGWAAASDTPFRKWKKWLHEGGIATPCIASWPGTLPAGDIDHRELHVMDLLPTFLELAGADYPTEYDGHSITPVEGVSFAPVLTDADGTTDWRREQPMHWEHVGNRALRKGNWKLVREFPETWELYDITADRTETHDLAGDRPGLVDELAAEWGAWKRRVGVLPWHPGTGYERTAN